jgi:hypothetical protein
MLDSTFISLKPISKSNGQGPEWSRLLVNDGIHITGKKEVRAVPYDLCIFSFTPLLTRALPLQGLNGVLYFIDGTIIPA